MSGFGLQGGEFLDGHGVGPALLNGGSAGPEGSVFAFALIVAWATTSFLLPWWRRSAGTSRIMVTAAQRTVRPE